MTRVSISKHKQGPYRVASIDVPVIIGDVPGSISIRCAHESACGALASAAAMAQQVLSDPTVGAVVPETAADDIEGVKNVAFAARAGYPVLHAASMSMTRGQRRLARALSGEARRFGGPDDDEAREVSGFFDSITDLAKSAVNSITNAADPDHWPAWLKKVAKPLSRVALDAAATAIMGPAGPIAVETMINVVDKAKSGDPDAEKQVEDIAKKALKGDKVSKLLMSAVHQSQAPASQAPGAVGSVYDSWMAQFGAAYEPGAFGDDDSRYLPPADDYDDAQQLVYYGQPQNYPQPYADDDASQPWPVDDQGNPWPADDQGNPVDPNAQPNVDPANVRDHRNQSPGAANSNGGARGGYSITKGAPRGGGGGFRGHVRSQRAGDKMPPRPPGMSDMQWAAYQMAWRNAHRGGR